MADPVKLEDVRKATKLDELGISGLEATLGLVREEWLRPLQSPISRNRIWREMRDNDPTIGAIFFAVEMLIRQVEWRVDAGEEGGSEEDAEFVQTCIHDMSHTWEATLSEILSFLTFGWSYHEIVYKLRKGPNQSDPRLRSRYDDGKVGWRKLPIRGQETLINWELDEDGGIQGLHQRNNVLWNSKQNRELSLFIPINKALLFRTAAHKGNPEGRSMLRNAYRPWMFKKRIEEIEGIGIERDLAGLPVAYVPARIMHRDASAQDRATLAAIKDIVRNIRRDEQEGVVFPGDTDMNGKKLFELTLLSTGGSRQFNTNEVVTRWDQRIAMTILADFILLGHEKVGSFALSSDKTSLFAVAIGAWLKEIADVFNRHAIPRLLKLNGMSLENPPVLKHGDIESRDIQVVADFITKLAGAGAEFFPDEELENVLRKLAGLPDKPPELHDQVLEQEVGDQQTRMEEGIVPDPNAPPQKEEEGKEKASVQKARKAPLYVCRPVVNAEEIIAWAKAQGFRTTLSAEDMHVTVVYSKKPVEWSSLVSSSKQLKVRGGGRSVHPLGEEGAWVLSFESNALQARHAQALAQGATWDYDRYIPHITISYNPPVSASNQSPDIEPFRGALVLGEEVFAEVEEDWADDIVEKHDE